MSEEINQTAEAGSRTSDVWLAALAGLLHDVGKVEQRARDDPWKPPPDLNDTAQPVHAAWSIYFAQSYVPRPYQRAALAGAYHHAPEKSPAADKSLSVLVALADKLSAGERADLPADYPKKNPPQQMVTVFDHVKLDGQGRQGGYHYLPLLPLALKKNVLWPADAQPPDAQTDAYDKLRFELEQAARQDISDVQTYTENLLYALQRFCWCVPSAYYHSVPDVSLYDHARTTAAMAACLTALEASDVQERLEAVQRRFQGEPQAGDDAILGRPVALLVGGDISGIQDFIYTITSQGAASALRGRSLYLQLLTEAVARYILRQLNLPVTNLIFAGGGHFFLLARHNDNLDKIRCEISRILLAFHGGDLYLALESLPLTAQDFTGKALPGKWRELSKRLSHAKTRKFSELQDDMRPLVFEPRRDQGNREKECQVCGREHPHTQKDGDTLKCPPCASYEELGKDLRKARYLRLSEVDCAPIQNDAPPGGWEAALRCFGMTAALGEQIPAALQDAHRSVVYALRDDALDDLKPDAHTATGRRFLVNVTPQIADVLELDELRRGKVRDLTKAVREGAVKPFEALEFHSRGIKRLGVLRMDVDDMGRIISEGLGELATLSRIATLSFMVNLFFEGWAAELARKYNREGGAEKDRVYSIYSGGDDLFFVGAWDVMPRLALEICNDLREFVAHHPALHASAGIALVGGRYPLYQAADDAHDALEEAKTRPGKNAINFLGQTIAWGRFADEVEPMANQLASLVEGRRAPRALLQKLAQFHRLYTKKQDDMRKRGEGETQAGESQVYWGPWNWRSAYYLKRLKVKDKEAQAYIDRLQQDLSGENFHAIEWIGLAARWADLLTRP